MFLQRVYLPVVYVTMLYIEVPTKRRIVGRLINELVTIREEAAYFNQLVPRGLRRRSSAARLLR